MHLAVHSTIKCWSVVSNIHLPSKCISKLTVLCCSCFNQHVIDNTPLRLPDAFQCSVHSSDGYPFTIVSPGLSLREHSI